MKNQIQLILKDNIIDVQGEKIERNAFNFLKIKTGKIKTGNIFNVTYDLSKENIEICKSRFEGRDNSRCLY